MTTAEPVPISIAPAAVSRRAPRRPITLDCHHEPTAQESAEAVSTMPADPDRQPSRLREHQRDEPVGRDERRRRQERSCRRGREPRPGGERAGRRDPAERRDRHGDPDHDERDAPHRGFREPGEQRARAEHQHERRADRQSRPLLAHADTSERRHHHRRGDHDQRQRREERPAPPGGLGEQRPHRGAEQPREDPHRGEQGHHPGPDPFGVGLRDGGERNHVEAAAADPLDEPRDHQHEHRGRRRREDEPGDVEADRAGQHTARTETVGQLPRDRHRAERRQRERRVVPSVELEPLEVLLDGGQDRRDDHELDPDEGLEDQQPRGEPAAGTREDLAPSRRGGLGRRHPRHRPGG